MFQLDIKINCKHLGDVLLLSRVTYITFVAKLQLKILHIRINHVPQP